MPGHISIHAPRGGSDLEPFSICNFSGISIHAPRGGSDKDISPKLIRHGDFNPRSPWGERRARHVTVIIRNQFQSTLPVGGATYREYGSCYGFYYFNPRSPWGERRITVLPVILLLVFQSTLPVGGATPDGNHGGGMCRISIHAPRGGSDRP